MKERVKIVIYGLGPIGERIAKTVLEKRGLQIVGAVDIAKDKVGKDLGHLLDIDKELGVVVTDDADTLFSKVDADIALVATTSYLKTVYPQVIGCIKAGINIISTCEQLAYPWISEPQLASEIDKLAKEHNVTVLGTGINPGFFMDTFPIFLTSLCRNVSKIEVTRAMPTGKRRSSFQKKIGTGMLPEEFLDKLKKGEITGHVGAAESIALTAEALGWKLDEIKILPPEPVLAEKETETEYTLIKPGHMLGYILTAEGIRNKEKVIVYKFVMHAGIEEGYEEYHIHGTPNVKIRMSEFLGDWETAHIAVNMIPKVLNAKPGLLTMKDIVLPSAFLNDVRIFIK